MSATKQQRIAGGDADPESLLVAIGDDLLQNILARLPASSFAFAATTCRAFRRVCACVLYRPKLLSALSLNPTLEIGVEEVLEKVLSEPIRPHFAIVYAGRRFSLKKTHELITRRLGKGIPVITSMAKGLIGCDAGTGEFKEVNWNEIGEEDGGSSQAYNLKKNVFRGILLILGFVPGLKVEAIPLFRSKEISENGHMVDSFLSNIKDFTVSFSDSTSPLGVLMFADYHCDVRSVIEEMDIALDEETLIVGDERCKFLYSNGECNGSYAVGGGQQLRQKDTLDAVALVFAKDKHKAHGVGDIYFSLALSVSLSPIGPSYRAASVRVAGGPHRYFTSLTARREGSAERIDGERILNDVDNALTGNSNYAEQLYCRVLRRRKCCCSKAAGKGKTRSYLNFHEIVNGDEEHLFVEGNGIRTADAFRICAPSLEAVLESRRIVHEHFKELNSDGTPSWNSSVSSNIYMKDEVFGGLMFNCCGRGNRFFGELNADSSVFLANFPNIPLTGIYCTGEIARGYSTETTKGEGQFPGRCYLHAYSTVYFLMSYAGVKNG